MPRSRALSDFFMSKPPLTTSSNDGRKERIAHSPAIETIISGDQSPSLGTKDESPQFAVELPFRSRKPPRMDAQSLPYEVLDLAIDTIEKSEICWNAMKLLANAKRIILVAGAGISVAAGIPDFRSPAGLFSTLKADTKYKPSGKALFDASVYKVCFLMAGELIILLERSGNSVI